jgi:hypothetical protein
MFASFNQIAQFIRGSLFLKLVIFSVMILLCLQTNAQPIKELILQQKIFDSVEASHYQYYR